MKAKIKPKALRYVIDVLNAPRANSVLPVVQTRPGVVTVKFRDRLIDFQARMVKLIDDDRG